MKFSDRADAGRRLAGKLAHLKERQPVVLALPRGGVAVGFEIAQALNAPLDIVLVRKIGVPWQPELALGAVTDGASPETFIDRDMAAVLDIPESYVQEATVRQLDEIERRRRTYCAGRPPLEITGRTAIVVDDGIATGATMQVAIRAGGAVPRHAWSSPSLWHRPRPSPHSPKKPTRRSVWTCLPRSQRLGTTIAISIR